MEYVASNVGLLSFAFVICILVIPKDGVWIEDIPFYDAFVFERFEPIGPWSFLPNAIVFREVTFLIL